MYSDELLELYEMEFTYNIICNNNMILNFGKLLIDQSTNHMFENDE